MSREAEILTTPRIVDQGTQQAVNDALQVYNEVEEIAKEKESEVQIVNKMSRRKAVIIVVVLLVVLALILIIAAAVITSQIQNVIGSGPSPPISTYITSTPVLGTSGVGIPQGGSLVSRPNFSFSALFLT